MYNVVETIKYIQLQTLWLRAIARRLTKEYGTPEIWKLHICVDVGSPSEGGNSSCTQGV